MKMVNGIPKSEKIWTHIFTNRDEEYFITSRENSRECYFIYKLSEGKAVKLGKSPSPSELEEKYIKAT